MIAQELINVFDDVSVARCVQRFKMLENIVPRAALGDLLADLRATGGRRIKISMYSQIRLSVVPGPRKPPIASHLTISAPPCFDLVAHGVLPYAPMLTRWPLGFASSLQDVFGSPASSAGDLTLR